LFKSIFISCLYKLTYFIINIQKIQIITILSNILKLMIIFTFLINILFVIT